MRVVGSASFSRLDLGSEVELTHLRTTRTFEGSLHLDDQTGEVRSVYGNGRHSDEDLERLSEIVAELNERFGLNLDERDQLLFDQFEAAWLADPEVVAQTQANSIENFRLVFDNRFMQTIVSRMDENEAIFKKILDDAEFQKALLDLYVVRVYRQAKAKGNEKLPKRMSRHVVDTLPGTRRASPQSSSVERPPLLKTGQDPMIAFSIWSLS